MVKGHALYTSHGFSALFRGVFATVSADLLQASIQETILEILPKSDDERAMEAMMEYQRDPVIMLRNVQPKKKKKKQKKKNTHNFEKNRTG